MVDSTLDADLDPKEPIVGSAEAGALAHLYRAEVFRSTVWRQRLDMTTNWAVVSTGIALSIAFADENASPLPIVLVGLLSVLFLYLESRRYRYFAVWKFRARILEMAVYVPILRGDGFQIPQDRGHPLSEDYLKPKHRISAWRAIGKRLRRNYAAIFGIQGLAYFAKISMHPTDVPSWEEFLYRAHIGPIPGWLVLIFSLIFHASWIGFALYAWYLDRVDTRTTADYFSASDLEGL